MIKLLYAVLLSGTLFLSGEWGSDLEKAKQTAQEEGKYILLNFSGSDWCGPCIKIRKTIFEAAEFRELSAAELILVNADFPRLKKNMLSREQREKNDALAEMYNNKGIFPLTLLLNAEGKVLKTWEGLPPVSPAVFTRQIKDLLHHGK